MTQSTRLSLFLDTYPDSIAPSGVILLVRPQEPLPDTATTNASFHAVQSFKPFADHLHRAGLTAQYSYPETADTAVVFLTRSKQENLANVAQAYATLKPQGSLIIDGVKTDGIESLLNAVKKRVALDVRFSKAHGKTGWLIKPDDSNPFVDWLDLTKPAQNAHGYWTREGLFSADTIDPASHLLVENLPEKLKGKIADLGAGWGYLSSALLQANTKIDTVDLFEAEHLALECAQRNVMDARASFHWEDVITMPTKPIYDAVIMNPPFHQARKSDVSIGQDFIAKAAAMLHPKGQLWMVANRQLAYEATLNTNFQSWNQVALTGQYKVISAQKPKIIRR